MNAVECCFYWNMALFKRHDTCLLLGKCNVRYYHKVNGYTFRQSNSVSFIGTSHINCGHLIVKNLLQVEQILSF